MLDFCSLAATIKSHFKENSVPEQTEYVGLLFHAAFLYNKKNYQIDKTQANKWLNGKVKVSSNISEYYLSQNSHQYKMIEDIKTRIVPRINDIEMAGNDLVDLLMNDPGISKSKKEDLVPDEAITTDYDLAEFVTQLLIFIFDRPFMPRDKTTIERLAEGTRSPVIASFIYSDDIPKPCPYFLGRDKEMEELEKKVSFDEKVFVTGIAGIGKSELVKAYIKKHRKDYTNILYLSYSGSLYRDIAALAFDDDEKDESEKDKYERHTRFLRSMKDDTLIFIDNLDTTPTEEKRLADLMKYRCRIIFTTRSRFDDYAQLELEEIQDKGALVNLVGAFYAGTGDNEDIIREIVESVHSHTLAVELVGRLLQRGILTPKKLLKKLKEEHIAFETADEISLKKDGVPAKDTYYGHIRTLFRLFKLKKPFQDIMRCMTFVPKEGMSARIFVKWIGQRDMNQINELIETGFIRSKNDFEIMLHPMIHEVAYADLKPGVKNCSSFLKKLMDTFVMHGLDISYYKILCRVTENIMASIAIDDEKLYLRFLEDAFTFMTDYRWESGLDSVIRGMKSLLEDEKVGTADDRANFYGYLGYMCELEGDHEGFLSYEKKALEVIEKNPKANMLLLANTHSNLATAYLGVGDDSHSEEHLMKAMACLEKTDQTQMHDKIAMGANFALLLQRRGKQDEGLKVLLNLEKEVGESNTENGKDYAFLEMQMGNMFMAAGNLKSAGEHFSKAKQIYEELYADDPELADNLETQMQNLILGYAPAYEEAMKNGIGLKVE